MLFPNGSAEALKHLGNLRGMNVKGEHEKFLYLTGMFTSNIAGLGDASGRNSWLLHGLWRQAG
uniref:Uncharacterized protein n=1 Tax=Ralstonia pickettii (strain 12D) TaxID=428406 RepID=C6BDZ8_RALP1